MQSRKSFLVAFNDILKLPSVHARDLIVQANGFVFYDKFGRVLTDPILVPVEYNEKVKDVKARLETLTGIPVDQQQLFYGDVELPSERTLTLDCRLLYLAEHSVDKRANILDLRLKGRPQRTLPDQPRRFLNTDRIQGWI